MKTSDVTQWQSFIMGNVGIRSGKKLSPGLANDQMIPCILIPFQK